MKTLALLALLGTAPLTFQAATRPSGTARSPQKVTTFLMFEGQAEEAMTFYVSLFEGSKVVEVERYGPGEPGAEGSVKHASFTLAGQEYRCIDSSVEHAFTFTPAISLFVTCDSQAEVDELWAKFLDGGGKPNACGWLDDRFGLSWQIVPTALPRLLSETDAEASQRVMEAMLEMSKLEIEPLERAAA